jgi:hypothetical protein
MIYFWSNTLVDEGVKPDTPDDLDHPGQKSQFYELMRPKLGPFSSAESRQGCAERIVSLMLTSPQRPPTLSMPAGCTWAAIRKQGCLFLDDVQLQPPVLCIVVWTCIRPAVAVGRSRLPRGGAGRFGQSGLSGAGSCRRNTWDRGAEITTE